MAKDEKHESESSTLASEAAGAQGSAHADALDLAALNAALDSARREAEEHKANWLRAQADYQNLRRRQLSDVEAAVRRAQSALIENVLLVLDYLEMALAIEVKGDEAKNLAQGVKMTRTQLLQALEREEVQAVATNGAFDPAMHEAVGTIETTEHSPGAIVQVVRSGWSFRGQVLRPAHVKVATPPPA